MATFKALALASNRSGDQSISKVVAQFDGHYHEGHEITRRKHLQINPFVALRVLRGS
jgi:hypothetical protein